MDRTGLAQLLLASMHGNRPPVEPPILAPQPGPPGWFQGGPPAVGMTPEQWVESLPGLDRPAPPPSSGFPLEGRSRMGSLPGNESFMQSVPPPPSSMPSLTPRNLMNPDRIPREGTKSGLPRLSQEQLDVIQGKPTLKREIQPKRGHYDI